MRSGRDTSADRLRRLPPAVRRLLARTVEAVFRLHGRNLFGVYAFGSVAHPGFTPYGDLDLLVALRKSPVGGLPARDRRMWRRLGRGRLGRLLDPFYIRASALSRGGCPREMRFGGRDESWALHRVHFLSGAFIRLFGPDPRPLMVRPTVSRVRRELKGEHRFALRQVGKYPAYAVMQFARLVMTVRTGRAANSKYATGRWARRGLSRRWRPLVAAAARIYRRCGDASAERFLRRNMDGIVDLGGFAKSVVGSL